MSRYRNVDCALCTGCQQGTIPQSRRKHNLFDIQITPTKSTNYLIHNSNIQRTNQLETLLDKPKAHLLLLGEALADQPTALLAPPALDQHPPPLPLVYHRHHVRATLQIHIHIMTRSINGYKITRAPIRPAARSADDSESQTPIPSTGREDTLMSDVCIHVFMSRCPDGVTGTCCTVG